MSFKINRLHIRTVKMVFIFSLLWLAGCSSRIQAPTYPPITTFNITNNSSSNISFGANKQKPLCFSPRQLTATNTIKPQFIKNKGANNTCSEIITFDDTITAIFSYSENTGVVIEDQANQQTLIDNGLIQTQITNTTQSESNIHFTDQLPQLSITNKVPAALAASPLSKNYKTTIQLDTSGCFSDVSSTPQSISINSTKKFTFTRKAYLSGCSQPVSFVNDDKLRNNQQQTCMLQFSKNGTTVTFDKQKLVGCQEFKNWNQWAAKATDHTINLDLEPPTVGSTTSSTLTFKANDLPVSLSTLMDIDKSLQSNNYLRVIPITKDSSTKDIHKFCLSMLINAGIMRLTSAGADNLTTQDYNNSQVAFTGLYTHLKKLATEANQFQSNNKLVPSPALGAVVKVENSNDKPFMGLAEQPSGSPAMTYYPRHLPTNDEIMVAASELIASQALTEHDALSNDLINELKLSAKNEMSYILTNDTHLSDHTKLTSKYLISQELYKNNEWSQPLLSYSRAELPFLSLFQFYDDVKNKQQWKEIITQTLNIMQAAQHQIEKNAKIGILGSNPYDIILAYSDIGYWNSGRGDVSAYNSNAPLDEGDCILNLSFSKNNDLDDDDHVGWGYRPHGSFSIPFELGAYLIVNANHPDKDHNYTTAALILNDEIYGVNEVSGIDKIFFNKDDKNKYNAIQCFTDDPSSAGSITVNEGCIMSYKPINHITLYYPWISSRTAIDPKTQLNNWALSSFLIAHLGLEVKDSLAQDQQKIDALNKAVFNLPDISSEQNDYLYGYYSLLTCLFIDGALTPPSDPTIDAQPSNPFIDHPEYFPAHGIWAHPSDPTIDAQPSIHS